MRLRSQRRRASRGCRTSRQWAIRYRTMRQAGGRAGRKRLLRREQGTGWSLKHLAHSAEVAPQFGGAFRARWRGKGRHPRSDTAHPRKSRRHLHGLLGRRSHQDQVSEHLCNPRRDSPRSACSFCRWTSNISWMSQCRQSDMGTPLLRSRETYAAGVRKHKPGARTPLRESQNTFLWPGQRGSRIATVSVR
jgi:hypothetical protein